MHRHHNGLKTAALFGGMWAILLGIGWVVAQMTGSSFESSSTLCFDGSITTA